MESPGRMVVWFSCGAASAVAAKLAVEAYGDRCHVVYCDTMASEHPDNARFFADVERWIERKIEVVKSAKYTTPDGRSKLDWCPDQDSQVGHLRRHLRRV